MLGLDPSIVHFRWTSRCLGQAEYDDTGVVRYLAKDKAFSTYFIPNAELFQTGILGARAARPHLLVEQTEQHGI